MGILRFVPHACRKSDHRNRDGEQECERHLDRAPLAYALAIETGAGCDPRSLRFRFERWILQVRQFGCENGAHLFCRLETVFAFLVVQLLDERDQPVFDVRVDLEDVARLFLAHATDHAEYGLSAKRCASGARGVQHAAEAVEIRTRIDRVAASLFGRHVLGCSGDGSAACHGRFVGHLCETEVGHDCAFERTLEHHVGRFDVAVHDALGMCCSESISDLDAEAHTFARGEGPVRFDALLQRLAIHETHHEIGQTLEFADGVDGHHVFVMDRGDRARFAQESCTCWAVARETGRQDLDGDDAAEFPVPGLDHDARAATAEKFLYFVFVQ